LTGPGVDAALDAEEMKALKLKPGALLIVKA
jgi:hypothetical protein